MERYYVDITGITSGQLELAGFIVLFEDNEFMWLNQKGDHFLIDKAKPYLYVDDRCDAEFLRDLRHQPTSIPLGPEEEKDKN